MSEWTWEEIRGWIDGEGYIYGRVIRRTIRGKPYIDKHIAVDIYQKDPHPITLHVRMDEKIKGSVLGGLSPRIWTPHV